MPRIGTLREVIVFARDVERLTTFYTEVFGLELAEGDPDHEFVRLDSGE